MMKKMITATLSALFLVGGVAAVAGCGEGSADTNAPAAEQDVPVVEGHPTDADGWQNTIHDHQNSEFAQAS
jgi:PBP1b-binding outer membrane lipoprotein LpoB